MSDRPPFTEEEIQAVTVGPLERLIGPIRIVEYDADWPRLFLAEERRVRTALGDMGLEIEHVGSTSVPGLAAKPTIDTLLEVADSADEAAYVPALVAAGYVLRVREPDWHQHRMFKGRDPDVNLHVHSRGCPEIERRLLSRDHLRASDSARDFYAAAKRELAQKHLEYVQNYADAKTKVIEEIIASAREEHPGR